MSVVATKIFKNEILIAADTQVTWGWTAFKDDKSAKIFRAGDGTIIGGCGLAEPLALMKIFTKTVRPKEGSQDAITEFLHAFHEWLKDHTDGAKDKNTYHIVTHGKAFLADGYYIQEIETFHAIGSGMEYAMTALHLGHTPEEAVKIACDLNIYCSEPVNSFAVYR